MMHLFNLQLFAESGAAGEAGGADGQAVISGGNNCGAVGAEQVAAAEGAVSKEAAASENTEGVNSMKDGRTPYAEIRQMYGKEIDAEMSAAIEKRLRRQKGTEENYKLIKPLADRAFRKYGVEPGNYKALMDAVNADEDYYEQLASEKGTTPEAERELERAAREASSAREELDRIRDEEAMREQFKRISAQLEEVRAIAPDFDLEEEMRNPTFAAMAKGGTVSLKSAYQAVHFDELTSHAMETAAKAAAQKVTNAVKSGGGVKENGVGGSAPASFKSDPSKMSLKEINDIMDRVKRGEIIRNF